MARILIVDDAAFMRMMIKDILTKNGYEIAASSQIITLAILFVSPLLSYLISQFQ